MTPSSLSRPARPRRDERRRFSGANGASSFNFRDAAFFGVGVLSALFGVVGVSFREFSRFIRRYDLVFISVARVAGFRRVASPESRGCLASFHEKLASERENARAFCRAVCEFDGSIRAGTRSVTWLRSLPRIEPTEIKRYSANDIFEYKSVYFGLGGMESRSTRALVCLNQAECSERLLISVHFAPRALVLCLRSFFEISTNASAKQRSFQDLFRVISFSSSLDDFNNTR